MLRRLVLILQGSINPRDRLPNWHLPESRECCIWADILEYDAPVIVAELDRVWRHLSDCGQMLRP